MKKTRFLTSVLFLIFIYSTAFALEVPLTLHNNTMFKVINGQAGLSSDAQNIAIISFLKNDTTPNATIMDVYLDTSGLRPVMGCAWFSYLVVDQTNKPVGTIGGSYCPKEDPYLTAWSNSKSVNLKLGTTDTFVLDPK